MGLRQWMSKRCSQRSNEDPTRALSRLLEQHRAFLWALASEEIGGETHLTFTVSDVVQSAQLEAVRDLPGFRGTSAGEFRSWLRHILRNNVLDLHRARDRRLPRARETVSTRNGTRSTIAAPAVMSLPVNLVTSCVRRSAGCRTTSGSSLRCTILTVRLTPRSANASVALRRRCASCGAGHSSACSPPRDP